MKDLNQEKFNIGLSFSALLHVILVLIFLFGVPSFLEKLPEENVITFEILPTSTISNVKNQDTKKEETKPVKEAQKVKQKIQEPKKEEVKPISEEKIEDKKSDIVKKEPEAPKKPEITKSENIPDKKKEVTPPKAKDSKPKKAEEKPKAKKIVKKEDDAIDAILKNLQKSSDGETTKSNNRSVTSSSDDAKYARGDNYDEDSPLSITEKQLIKQQIEKNWQRPIGLPTEGVFITISIDLAQDGSITKVEIIDISSPPGLEKSLVKLFEEGAIRAVWKTKIIENLSPERYDVWKKCKLRFHLNHLM